MHNGYIMILSPSHPYRKGNNYVFEHRLVVEKSLNRYLDSTEVVHHINHIKTDNRLENLVILTKSQHTIKHRHLKGKWSIKYDKCLKCGTTTKKHGAKGLCRYCYKRSFGNRKGEVPAFPKRIIFNNEIATKASRRLGGCRTLIAKRIGYGWSIEKAFTTPLKS